MLHRLSLTVLAVSVIACASPAPPPVAETSAPAIQHFFGEQEEQPAMVEEPAPVVVEEVPAPAPAPVPKPAPVAASPVPVASPTPVQEPTPEAIPAEPAPSEKTDAVQYFFGEGETPVEVRPEEDVKDEGSGEGVDAFDHFFGEKPPSL